MADAEEPKGSDPRRKLTFNDMPRLGRPAMDSQLERIRACYAMRRRDGVVVAWRWRGDSVA